MWNHRSHGPPEGGGQNFKKAVVEVAMMELICFLNHHKDNDDAYTFVTGCRQQCFSFFKLLQFVCPHRGVYGWNVSIYSTT